MRSGEPAVVDGRGAQPALRPQRVVGNDADARSSPAARRAARRRRRSPCRAPAASCRPRARRPPPPASAPRRAARGGRGDAPASWRRRRDAAGSRAGSGSTCTVPTMPAASSATNSSRAAVAPRRSARPRQNARGALARQRLHEAHRRAAFDAVDQHVGQSARCRRSRTSVVEPAGSRRDHHGIARGLARAIAEGRRPVEHEGEAVAFLQARAARRRP